MKWLMTNHKELSIGGRYTATIEYVSPARWRWHVRDEISQGGVIFADGVCRGIGTSKRAAEKAIGARTRAKAREEKS
jgi:hypothetical protein